MGWPETCFINNSTKTTDLRDLLIVTFLIGVPLQMDDSFLWSSDPIKPELGPPDSLTPMNYEIGTNRSGRLV
jgi:hypothetical protein